MNTTPLQSTFQSNGFKTQIGPTPFDLLAESERVFVTIKFFDDFAEMVAGWAEVQAALATEFYVPNGLQEAKFWDTYLLLICPDVSDAEQNGIRQIEAILQDLAYCRKLIVDTKCLDNETLLKRQLSPLFEVKGFKEWIGLEPVAALRQRLKAQPIPPKLIDLLDETDSDQLVERVLGGMFQ